MSAVATDTFFSSSSSRSAGRVKNLPPGRHEAPLPGEKSDRWRQSPPGCLGPAVYRRAASRVVAESANVLKSSQRRVKSKSRTELLRRSLKNETLTCHEQSYYMAKSQE